MALNPCCRRAPQTLKALAPQRMRKTWRTPFEKAGGDPDAEYQWLHDIADAAAADIRAAFLKAIDAIRGSVKEEELRAALETKNVDKVLAVLNLDQQMQDALRVDLIPKLEDTMIQAGRTAPIASMPKGAELRLRFDLTNPNTARFLQQYEFTLVREVTDDTRSALRDVVRDAMQFGGHPYEQARTIKEMIGLTDKQAQAVANFRGYLMSGDRTALQREHRDRRFDRILDRALGENPSKELSEDQIDKMVTRYRDNMLQARAETIARTETINSAQAGQQLAWGQAADKGLLSRTNLRQGWLVTPDDRLCLICALIPEMNPHGVPLGGYFQTPVGPVQRPTVHPQCRCSLYLMAF